MTSKSNLVCAGIDDGYLWPFLVSIFAAKIHSTNDFRVAVGSINGGLGVKSKRVIQNFAKYMEVPIEIRDFTLNENLQTTHLNIQIYTRLLWLDNLQENFLWLDADTLPLENWDEVFEQLGNGASEFVIAAALDSTILRDMGQSPNNCAYKLGGASYFNDGIFLGNPILWQQRGYPKKWLEVGKRYEELGFTHHEQDILNYILAADKKIMRADFNAIVMPGSSIEQKILHFTGNPKPWHFGKVEKRYFISIEVLKDSKTGRGAFGGTNWVYEYLNYWRHEEALLARCQSNPSLASEMSELFIGARRELLDRKDKIKLIFLDASGKKWL
jgi:lipopolysaccharide biosynthesis glycosyltransferase